MLYDRKIKYSDYLENGERLHGAGFVKLEARGNRCNLTVNVSGLHVTDHYARQVYLVQEEGEQPLCELKLWEGRGVVERRDLDCDNLGGTGISYGQLRAVHIPIAAGKDIRCVIQPENRKPKPRPQPEAEPQPKTEPQLEPEPEPQQEAEWKSQLEPQWEPEPEPQLKTEPQRKPQLQSEPQREMEPQLQPQPQLQPERRPQPEPKPQSEPQPELEPQSEPELQPQPEEYPLLDEKWRQLSAIYPHIMPFRDEREYLSIGPEDFVVLAEKYYKLVNNSFLLHGYYNYNHLILVQTEQRGETRYYVGVPGNFYEREKQVAIMFGFESFECLEEPAREGDYGYYMIRVEL